MTRGGAARVGRRRGGAMAMALLVMVVLLILGTSFLMFLERDYRGAGHQERSEQAWFLALAGLEYQRAHPVPPGATVRRSVPRDSRHHYFEVSVAADGTVTSRGVVEGTLSGGPGRAPSVERAAIAPGGALEEAYDASL